ncbi:MAG: multicopper oxidase family protein [Pseudohongiella sp.]|nr:multicopper oxidase family protein [Pseudohongiella sp.]
MLNRREFLQALSTSTVAASTLAVSALSAAISSLSVAQSMTHNMIAPATATPGFVPDVELELTARVESLALLPGQTSQLWRYVGTVLFGDASALSVLDNSHIPVIRARQGQKFRIHFRNQLPEESTIHWHGLHMVQRMDGHPMYAIPNGATYVYEFTVTNRAGTYWFHPHPHERTGHQVYHGLSGLFLVSDENEQQLQLPSGEFDLPLIVQDRTFDASNQLVYLPGPPPRNVWMQGFTGQAVLVNGKQAYSRTLKRTAYRLRLFNASNASNYILRWSHGVDMTVIGTDGGLLETPVQRAYLSMAPAERIDVWIDLSQLPAGQDVSLLAESFSPALSNITATQTGAALVQGARPIARFVLDSEQLPTKALPPQLSVFPPLSLADAINTSHPRTVLLSMMQGQVLLNGRVFGVMDEYTEDEIVRAGTTEIWEFANNVATGMQMSHPMHIHNVHFKVLERIPGANESITAQQIRAGFVDEGLKDVVQVLPGERVRVLLTYEPHAGIYLYHCHILEHEDLGMMRNFMIRAALVNKTVATVGGATSSARIELGTSVDNWMSLTAELVAPAHCHIMAAIQPEAAHRGRRGNIIVVVSPDGGTTLLAVNNLGQLQPLDSNNVQVFTTVGSLAERHEFSLFNGLMDVADKGIYDLFIGYTVDDSRRVDEIIYNTTPLRLTVR